jgi:hypothetical protein
LWLTRSREEREEGRTAGLTRSREGAKFKRNDEWDRADFNVFFSTNDFSRAGDAMNRTFFFLAA